MKDSREGESLVRSGKEFQILGAAALNALEPMLVLTCGCAKSAVLVSAMHEKARTAVSSLLSRQESCAAEA